MALYKYDNDYDYDYQPQSIATYWLVLIAPTARDGQAELT